MIEELKSELPEEQRAQYSTRHGWSAPFVWIEEPDGRRRSIGRRDALYAWALEEFASHAAVCRAASAPLSILDTFYTGMVGTATAPVHISKSNLRMSTALHKIPRKDKGVHGSLDVAYVLLPRGESHAQRQRRVVFMTS